MLRIRVFNAGKGDSIVVKNEDESGASYIVVDSHANPFSASGVDVIEYLRAEGAEKISMLVLTHPHADHYGGMLEIIEEFPPDEILCYPTYLEDTSRIKKLARVYQKYVSSECDAIRIPTQDFIRIIRYFKENESKVRQVCGPENVIRPIGFSSVDFRVILPFKSALGDFARAIDQESDSVINNSNLNSLSVVLLLNYAGVEVVLGADGIRSAWMEHRKKHAKGRDDFINASIVKLPHHGASADSADDVMGYLFSGGSKDKIALISASGGRAHPSKSVIDSLVARGIKPYCTNLADSCRSLRALYTDRTLDSKLVSFVNQTVTEGPRDKIACQGWIEVSIDDSGKIEVETERKAYCPYRAAI